jgi:1-acyl-sn-glycerol-3-phosphate acyltransferase
MKNFINALRGVIFFFWFFVSTLVYGTMCILTAGISRNLAWKLNNTWAAQLLAVGGVRLRVFGVDRIHPGKKYVFIANHSSSLDIPILFEALPVKLVFMAKKELFYLPVFGQGITVMGHIPIDRGSARKARGSISRAVARLKERTLSVLLFPEGTRSKTGEIGEFRHASFAMAKELGFDVVPIYIHGARNVLPKKAWFITPGTVDVYVGEPFPAGKYENLDRKQLSEIMHQVMVGMQKAC